MRNKIYKYLLTEPRNVSGRKLVELREHSRGGDLWKQFQSAIAIHPLTATCRQMRTEFGSVLATTAGQIYHFNVNNLDPYQLTLFREFVTKYCFSHMIFDKNFPRPLIHEVVLCLNLDGNIIPSIKAYREAAYFQSHSPYAAITRHCSSVTFMLKDDSSDCDDSTSKSKSMTKVQAKLARDALRRICDVYEPYQLYEPDLSAMRLVLRRLTEMVNNQNHYCPTTSDETKDSQREPQPSATPSNAHPSTTMHAPTTKLSQKSTSG